MLHANILCACVYKHIVAQIYVSVRRCGFPCFQWGWMCVDTCTYTFTLYQHPCGLVCIWHITHVQNMLLWKSECVCKSEGEIVRASESRCVLIGGSSRSMPLTGWITVISHYWLLISLLHTRHVCLSTSTTPFQPFTSVTPAPPPLVLL